MRDGSLRAVSLGAIQRGAGREAQILGDWGALELDGPLAVLKLTWSPDVVLTESVSLDLTGGTLLLNDEHGQLHFLPYASEAIVSYDLREGSDLNPSVHYRLTSRFLI